MICYKCILGLRYDADFDDSNLCWHGRGYKVNINYLNSLIRGPLKCFVSGLQQTGAHRVSGLQVVAFLP